jgi:glycosyltransferase involved in cell wall biosynthesis
VSVILPCYNEQSEIESAIVGLEKQTFGDREIIVVDDGSTDSTMNIASHVVNQNNYRDIRLVSAGRVGVSHARNVGASESRGAIVFFAECDCIYSPDYIEKAVGELERTPAAAAVCLTGAPMITHSTIATECISIENRVQHRLLEEGKIKPFYAWVFRRDAFSKIGGYDEGLSQAEDKDIFKRLTGAGYQVAWIAGEHWWHKRDQSIRDVAVRRFRRAQNRMQYLLKHRLVPDLIKVLAPIWLLVLGVLLLPFIPLAGGLAIASVFIGWALVSIRFAWRAWGVAPKRQYLIAYPVLVMVRSFSESVGSTIGLGRYVVARPSQRSPN